MAETSRCARRRHEAALQRFCVLVTVAICSASCLTAGLWEATNPAQYVAVSHDRISESELRERKIGYVKDDEHGLYYVEKTNLRRLGDYSVRALVAPVTVLVDAAAGIAVIGVVVGAAVGVAELEELHRKSTGEPVPSEWP